MEEMGFGMSDRDLLHLDFSSANEISEATQREDKPSLVVH